MSITEIGNIVQNGAIVVAFLFLTFQAPSLYGRWLASQKSLAEMANVEAEKTRHFHADERKLDRDARHTQANQFTSSISEAYQMFREELAAERAQCAADHKEILEAIRVLAGQISRLAK